MNTDQHRALPVAEPDLGPLEEQYLLEAFRSGWISSLGAFISRFEGDFARFCDVDHAIAVSNGTVAIHLVLAAANIGPGDEVIVPALTFVATAAAVRHAGATPVFADSEATIGTLDPAAVERAITPRTKAIIAVHLYGHPADMDPLMAIARRHELLVIEDAAEAHGARYRDRAVGGLGDVGTFSFYGNKILTTGEGGMVTTRRAELAKRMRFLKDHAMSSERRYWHPEVGYNYRMTNLQAAIGCAQLERFTELCEKRQRVLDAYRVAFAGTEVLVNPAASWARPVPWLVSAILPANKRDRRDRVIADLKAAACDSRPFFHSIADMPPYSACRRVSAAGEGVPVAEDLSARGINLPSVSWLTDDDVARVRESVGRSLA